MTKFENTPQNISCWFERWVKSKPYFVLIHDGSRSSDGKRRAFFTRKYQIVRHNKLTSVCVKFTYDYREQLARVELDDIVMDIKKREDITKQAVTDETIGELMQGRVVARK